MFSIHDRATVVSRTRSSGEVDRYRSASDPRRSPDGSPELPDLGSEKRHHLLRWVLQLDWGGRGEEVQYPVP